MSLEKVRSWMQTSGRRDVSKDLSAREKEVLDRVGRIALDLDGVVLHQGAKAGQGGEQYDLSFGRKRPGRKTPVLFLGVLFRPKADQLESWPRRSEPPAKDSVRIYLKISVAAAEVCEWSYLFHDDDAIKPDTEWRYLELPDRVDVQGDEILDLIEDAYFAVAGI